MKKQHFQTASWSAALGGRAASLATLAALAVLLAPMTSCEKEKADSRAVLQVRSTPPGAKITLNEDIVGDAPITMRVPPGNHRVKFEKEGFKTTWRLVECPQGGQANAEAKLEPITSSVVINSVPPGASVEIDERMVGVTPLTLFNLAMGDYAANLSAVKYSPQQITWSVNSPRPALISARLRSNVGILKVTSTPDDSPLTIDGQARGRTPFESEMEAGSYKVEVERAGHETFEQTVAVAVGETSEVQANLPVIPGKLEVVTTPAGAEVFLNERQRGTSPLTIENLQPGRYQLSIRKDDFDPFEREIDINPAATTKIERVLESNFGGIDLVVSPAGVTVYLNGQRVGVTEPADSVRVAKVFEIRDVPVGRHRITLAHSRANPPKREFPVSVMKGQITRPAPVEMWIADHRLELKDGSRWTGRLRMRNEQRKEIIFEPQPGVAQTYKFDEIAALTELSLEE